MKITTDTRLCCPYTGRFDKFFLRRNSTAKNAYWWSDFFSLAVRFPTNIWCCSTDRTDSQISCLVWLVYYNYNRSLLLGDGKFQHCPGFTNVTFNQFELVKLEYDKSINQLKTQNLTQDFEAQIYIIWFFFIITRVWLGKYLGFVGCCLNNVIRRHGYLGPTFVSDYNPKLILSSHLSHIIIIIYGHKTNQLHAKQCKSVQKVPVTLINSGLSKQSAWLTGRKPRRINYTALWQAGSNTPGGLARF